MDDGVNVDFGGVDFETDVEWKKDITWKEDNSDLAEIFFEHFFPCVKGHAKLIDDYHSSKNSPYYLTVERDKIKFHQEDDEDPDWMVKQCYLILVASVTEVECGAENLWKQGRLNGRKEAANFGRYMTKNYFKAFISAAPYCFAEKKWWYIDKRDRPWDIYLPCLQSYNCKRQALIKTLLLVLDESMSGWCPKTSKLGGLPNYTFEPRKPVPLGTMFKNGAECKSGLIVFQDVVMDPEMQHTKEFSDCKSHLPDGSMVLVHTAEVLRQAQGAKVEKDGWVGGDAWFGSVATSVELRKRLGLHSTFVVKNNTNFFPMRVLHRILQARYGERSAGHWVVMKTQIVDVPIFCLTYAWSQRGISYFVSTCGSTEVCKNKYMSNYEDEYGNICHNEINRPDVVHFLYEFLPIIDEHNKQRQSLLGLERKWATRDCWFRLLTSMVGFSIVDMHRWYRNMVARRLASSGPSYKRARNTLQDIFMVENEYEIQIRKFSDMLCSTLESRVRKQLVARTKFCVSRLNVTKENTHCELERIRGVDGSTTRPPTEKQLEKGRKVGTSVNSNCFICRKYKKSNDTINYVLTTWCCSVCKMPLCKEPRKNVELGRIHNCLEEHMCAKEAFLRCENYRKGKVFPLKEMVNLHRGNEKSSSEVTNENNEDAGSDKDGEDDGVISQPRYEEEVPATTRRSKRISEAKKRTDDSGTDDSDDSCQYKEMSSDDDTSEGSSYLPESTQETLKAAMQVFQKFQKPSRYGKKIGNERLQTRINRISDNVRNLQYEPRFPQPVPKKPRMTVGEFEALKKKQKKNNKITNNKGTMKKKRTSTQSKRATSKKSKK